ncbi:3-deoxy-D-manno-octulosonic acid transferase [Moraxella cuniculi]|uniref:3-deoxy-D-manno-octulosonic acid transferase n=1 Tax=Moraxella cuniculi TaxID=34061 RepID=A0A3S4UU36_9GAMM|nr:3-deoxy-D-manno-octulosonic acid transferase [Moraxella cuniculi]VEG13050.1 3-deoxy-D-manno-octulosonic-acid transferase [Moraxella cuniculi]
MSIATKPPVYYRAAIAMLSPLYRLWVAYKSKSRLTRQRELDERFAVRYLPVPVADKGVIWCHAVSLGELNTAYPLLEKLLEHGFGLWISSTTQTGFERAKRLFAEQIAAGSVSHSFVPVDRPVVLERFLAHTNPVAALFVETELWANTLYACRRRGIATVMINARLTEKSYQGYAKFAQVSKTMMANLDSVIAQDKDSAERFLALGAKKVAVADSLKWASVSQLTYAQQLLAEQKAQEFGRAGKTHIWVMASTHEGEEALAIAAHQALIKQLPNALLILVPRHPERFEAVYQLCQQSGVETVRRSQQTNINEHTQVYLADSMGELLAWYQLADIAVVGGSFVPMGGHNPIEPASLGKPVIIGSYDTNCHELVRALKRVGALAQLDATDDKVAIRLFEAIMQAYLYRWTGESGAELVASKQQAVFEQLSLVLQAIKEQGNDD